MHVEYYIPAEPLRPFVKNYLIIECPEEQVNKVLPDTSLVMAFRYKGKVSYLGDDIRTELSASVISGLRSSGRLIRYSENTGNILVIFKEARAHAFIREPVNELFNDSIALDRLAGYQELPGLEEQLAGAVSNRARIDLIERFLSSRLYQCKSDPLILAALGRIHASKGTTRIKDLAGALYISQDAFEKRFRKIVGVSPKKLSNIVRMQSIVRSGLKEQSFAGIAFDAGYHDQPHFNKDFRLFTGQTPTEFLKSPVFW